ncbi:hypothetical protein [uncultured Thalassospira sp.]|uniref:hypothetical protein n=1 Tax=uncultured Thalassospira sp. TaxID=404382 RepID=UPI000E9D276E|nr:hypothetical protein [uncultured Thalassospira sp.]HAY48859.1 hypothetical protein [Thalassospira sp.]|tara:strand:+ start:2284 stop:2760 length:477 start_codon:yes stop_codon:yes gene_type:complete
MAYAQEIEIPHLPEDTESRVRAYYEVWQAAAKGGKVPDRKVLNGHVLAPWVDDICIYEYLPQKRDFIIRIDAPNIIEASGEDYHGCSPRQIDLDFGTTLHATLLEVIDHGKPAFHRIGYERKVWEEWLRLLLPVRATDRQGRVIDQVFVTHFFYRGAS